MDEILQEILAEEEHILETLYALQEVLGRKEKGIIELSAIATFLQNTYNGIENIIKRILKFKGITIPVSESFHKDLLDIAIKNRIISFEISKKFDEYRAFRHFFIHGYGIMLDAERLMPLAENLQYIWEQFKSELGVVIESLKEGKEFL